MQKIQFDYFRGMEAEQYSFYRVPKVLFTAECFKSLSCEAKVLYGLMLDRMSLSIKNRWFDDEDRVYIIFTVDEIAELMNCGTQKAVKLIKELDTRNGIGLIEKKRLGLGKPNVIYVKNFMIKEIPNQLMKTDNVQKQEEYFTEETVMGENAGKIADMQSEGNIQEEIANGRLLKRGDFSQLHEKYRFVIPIHGIEVVHDKITGIPGSYKETITGLRHLVNTSECAVDIKLILNQQLMEADPDGTKIKNAFDTDIVFNNAIHLTKMADTIVSMRHGCSSVSNEEAAGYMNIYFDYFTKRNVKVKLFDTCIKDITGLEDAEMHSFGEDIVVYFKDHSQFWVMDLSRQLPDCYANCKCKNKCLSAVDEYKALVFANGEFYEELE